MRLRYGLLCDYAAPGGGNKPTIIGVYEGLYLQEPPAGEMLRMIPGFLHGIIDAASVAGPRHLLETRLVDADANEIHKGEMPCVFGPRGGSGSGLVAYLYLFIRDLTLPGYGDYEWIISVDGIRVGSIDFFVHPTPPQHQVAQ